MARVESMVAGVRTRKRGPFLYQVFVDGVLVSEHGTMMQAEDEAQRLRDDKKAKINALAGAPRET